MAEPEQLSDEDLAAGLTVTQREWMLEPEPRRPGNRGHARTLNNLQDKGLVHVRYDFVGRRYDNTNKGRRVVAILRANR